MSDHKDEFPPLLQDGLHKMSRDDLRKLTVDAFPRSAKRQSLWNDFIDILDRLRDLGLTCDVWVDGSFLTEKIDPTDVDFVLDLPIAQLEQCNAAQADFLEELSDRSSLSYRNKKMHSFIMHTAPMGHLLAPESKMLHDQWSRDFGQSYVTREPKGIAVVEVRP